MERLEQHARSLALAQHVAPVGGARPALPRRLKHNYDALVSNFRLLADAAKRGKSITSAGEWFLDNFHIVEEQIRQAQKDLPASFYRELPRLVDGPLAGYPRVYGIAWAMLAHSDSDFDVEKLERFISAYQEVAPLAIGELWAIAITLRITLVENLRRLTQVVVGRVIESSDGGDTVQDLLSRFEQHLGSGGENAARALRDVRRNLDAQGLDAEALLQAEYQAQAADDVSVRNVITSMRLVSNINWSEFFERVSLVDAAFAAAPGYGAMDFASRDRYRRAVERLARRSPQNEIAIARAAVATAARADDDHRPRERDPGYYLFDKGRRAFERSIGYRLAPGRYAMRLLAASGLGGYVGLIAALTCLVAGAAVTVTFDLASAPELVAPFFLLALLPASDLAIALVNRAVTRRNEPQSLPALALKDGVPPDLRTILVVPVLFSRVEDIAAQVQGLEVHYLANASSGLTFVLLSDWTDSDTEHAPDDDDLLDAARREIAALNTRYADGRPLFLLLHRRRRFNPAQGKWMGWERKRGKLHELNRLLRGATDTSFLDADAARTTLPANVRYVITLDADTRLPRGAARRLIGKMAHPLNRPVFDARTGCVIAGHGIMQPRVTPSLPIGAESSLFQWAFSGPNGLDPYAFAVSDVYQDLFSEGSFVGKGIYDVDAFERALDEHIPENAVLSHDLLEGVFARAALVSDVEVVEEFPSRYDVEAARQHRWMRGDWQLLPWILGFRSGLNALGRWKLTDNLRRSLGTPALLLAFLCGWLLPFAASLAWTCFLIIVVALPPLMPVFTGLFARQRGLSGRGHLRNLARDGVLASMQILFTVTFMARLAFLALDAILRTLFRLLVSRKRLLEWVTFAQSAYSRRSSWRATGFQLAGSFALVVAVVALVARIAPGNLPFAMPFLALWGFSPIIARWASHSPDVEPHLEISDADTNALRLAARRTWFFFERFVGAGDNFLPPDNFQEDPRPLVAHRTSPTNIGLYLCTVLAAHDFGWIGTGETVERLEKTLRALERMERYRGHFYNWYETEELRPLDPRYVSSVDSGNLAGDLLVVKNACGNLLSGDAWRNGIGDTLGLMREGLNPHHERIARIDAFCARLARAPRAQFIELAVEARALAEGLGGTKAQDAAAALLRSLESHEADDTLDEGALSERLAAMAALCDRFVKEMEFGFLFDETRQLLSIGFRVDDQALDANAYDLLASEARLASFLAIAKGDIPTRHWFRLGRTLTPQGRMASLQSWSGSMFEYLMPTLIMHEPPGSLLARSNRAAVRQQIKYAAGRGVPWGISESQYNARDRDQNYQYSGFGVPLLGIKRGLAENLVIAPYATGLAAMIAPAQARANLDRLTAVGARGAYGWYEAIDYTRERVPAGATRVVIRAYMAHHQAMLILGLADVLNDGRMRERFHAEPMVKATELLLQERMPRDAPLAEMPPSLATGAVTYHDDTPHGPRLFSNPHGAVPRTHLLANPNYGLMLTAAGSGYSRWRGIALTRWREDGVRDPWGTFFYLRDVRSGAVWSTTHNPVGRKADSYEAAFAEDRAQFRRVDGSLTTVTEICLSPEDDAEVRRISITNDGTRMREIDLTSYMELALAPPADDAAHPAFSKLFVETEFLRDSGALIATRRPRAASEQPVWIAHLSVLEDGMGGEVQYETDRGKFIGRGRAVRNASAVFEDWPLSDSAGAVLDPVFSIRRRLQVPRGATVTIAFWTMVAATREALLDLIDRHHDAKAFERASTLAATHAQSQLQYLAVSGEEAHLFQLLANCLIHPDANLRAPADVITAAAPPATVLWPLAISGDLPILLLRVADEDDIGLARQLVRAHDYFRARRFAADLVIVNEQASSYAQDLQQALSALASSGTRMLDAAAGRVFCVRSDLITPEQLQGLRAAARVELDARKGTLAEQLDNVLEQDAAFGTPPARAVAATVTASSLGERPALEFFNGYGGFADDGREYAVLSRKGEATPAPWVNIIANQGFGFQISAEGAGFAWALNSQQNQITPWSNDPVSNEGSEAIYLKDRESGQFWSPMPYPAADAGADYMCRHGQGYSSFESKRGGIATSLTHFAALSDPVKLSHLVVRNTGDKPRKLALTYYALWCLGASREAGAPYLQTQAAPEEGAIFARNPVSGDFGHRVGFLALGVPLKGWTADRREFIGRNGNPADPQALRRDAPLSGRTGAGLDPCAALQTEIELAPGAQVSFLLLLGQGEDDQAARALVAKYRGADADALIAEVRAFWDGLLGTLEVRTPDRSLDLLVNRWLVYQTLSCRMWGRAGFYQVSGAYGFRDQLQDSMALCMARPDLSRAQLLRAAGRQFPEGDVQHWWLPESGKGIRTRISDDKAWLAYVAAHYVETTGDMAVLDEALPFLTGDTLRSEQHDAFFQPGTGDSANLYEHCARALDASLAVGTRGLPLIGTGDWNDGMNRIGEGGKGESVWLGWFLHAALARFCKFAEARGDAARAARWLVHMDALRDALEQNGWDGAWYRRAYFDDGFAIGSAANRECRIDAIAQSWAVISGAAAPDRQRRAMMAMERYLVRPGDRLMTLFSPPFAASSHDPGYIMGYPAGIRENGGQYTHGVLWGILAFAMLGDGDKAGELFAMLNPINHARSQSLAQRYRVEPYVACGDVYSVPPHIGRGGWTWYSGSAAWMYRVAVEYMLGLRLEGDHLVVDPVIPSTWPGFEATLRLRGGTIRIAVDNPQGVCRGVASLLLDGAAADTAKGIPLDGRDRQVKVLLGARAPVKKETV